MSSPFDPNYRALWHKVSARPAVLAGTVAVPVGLVAFVRWRRRR